MKEFQYIITDDMGIHARPAGLLVKEAKSYECAIKLVKDGKTADCKGILGVMGIGAKKGDEVTLIFDGSDEDAAYEKLGRFFQENL